MQNSDKPITTYGYKIKYEGGLTEVDGCKSIEEAVNKCFDVAFLGKYQEPPRWKFWKRNIRKECDKVIQNWRGHDHD